MDKKKAAFIVTEYNENVYLGGGEKVNSYVIEELLNRNYAVDIYTNISYIEKSDKVNIFIKDKNFEKNYKQITKDYDLVLSTNLEYASDITYSHNHTFIFGNGLKKNYLWLAKIFSKAYKKKKIKHETSCQNVPLTSKIVVSSNIVKEDYLKNFKIPTRKLHILPPAVEYREVNIKLPDKNMVVFGISAGNFKRKGGYITLKAVSYLKKIRKNFKLKMVCKNPNDFTARFLIKLWNIENYVELLPLQRNMQDFYSSIDFMLVPSVEEPFGLVTTEAMSYSKPPVISSVCGSVDFLKDGQNGFVVDFSKKDKSKELSLVMNKALNLSESEYRTIAQNAHETIKDLDWNSFSKKYADLAEQRPTEFTPKISVIIPVYNTARYLPECLNSILNQDLYEIEVICVDDCSKDNSIQILEDYAKHDNRIKILKTQKPSGSASMPRNIGLSSAKGEYVYFIDNDDYITNDYLSSMYNKAKETDAEVVFNDNIIAFGERMKSRPQIQKHLKDGIYEVSPALITERHTNSLPWSKIYKRDFLEKHNLKFNEKYIYEDECFYFMMMPYCKKILQANTGTYYYRQNKHSVMGQGKTRRKYELFTVFRTIYDYYKQNDWLDKYEMPYYIFNYRSHQYPSYHEYRKMFLELVNELEISKEELFKYKKIKRLYTSSNRLVYRLKSYISCLIK